MERNLLVFGDSIVYGSCDKEGGWVNRLRMFLDADNDSNSSVYNLGISGNDTENLLERIEKEIVDRFDEDEDTIIIISIGINDSQFVHSKDDFNVPLETFKSNLENIHSIARRYSSKILFVGLTAVDDTRTDPIPWNVDKTYKNEYIGKYNDIIEGFAKENDIGFVKIFEDWSKDIESLLDVDGLHPNSKGHEKIFQYVKDYLLKNKII
jgi:lysophospholipase L1-like esterase